MHRPAEPVFLRIAGSIVSDIRNGVLAPGGQVASTRALAAKLGVHRNTVVAAYRELISEGWLTSRPGARTLVADSLPEDLPHRLKGRMRGVPVPLARAGFTIAGMPPPNLRGRASDVLPVSVPKHARRGQPRMLFLSEGAPDPRLLPASLLARGYRRALRDTRNLEYQSARGHARLRTALAGMLLRERRLHVREDNLFVTAGSQMALDLVAESLCGRGAWVAVEEMGYAPAWGCFTRHGARVQPIPVDRHGIDVEQLARLCSARGKTLAAVYVTPHHQYPTTVTLSQARRLALLDLAQRAKFAIIEDDYDHEYHYGGRPILPLASEDRAGVVLYIGTLSKIVAPSLRMGYVAGPSEFVAHLGERRFLRDRHGDPAMECALAELLEDGDVARHVWRSRRVYLARRDALVKELTASFADVLSFTVPNGGMALWAEVRKGIDVEAWLERAFAAGVAIRPARHFAFDGRPRPFLRLGFAYLTEEEMREGLETLRRTLPARSKMR
ncbi:MAG: PLP-dependent aminotransferase family protein [Polyangiaceae bacterium]